MKNCKLFFTTPLVTSTFSLLILFGCSGPMNRLENRFTVDTVKGTINALAFSPDGKLLAVASSEGIRIYDTQSKQFSSVLTKESGILALTWSDQGLASGSGSTIALWNVETKERQQTFDGGAEALGFIDNTWIFCVTYKYKNIDGWNIHTGNRAQNYPQSIPRPGTSSFKTGDHSEVYAPPGAFVHPKKRKPGYEHIQQTGVPSAAAFASNGTWGLALKDVMSNNHKGTVEYNFRVVVSLTEEKKGKIIKKMKTPVAVMAFSTDSNFLATGGRTDTKIHLWNVKTGKLLRSLTTQTNGITALAFSIDRMLASGSRNGTITLWGPSD